MVTSTYKITGTMEEAKTGKEKTEALIKHPHQAKNTDLAEP
jgi:hypothetical protein